MGAKAFFSKDEALMKKHATETLPNGLDKLEKRLTGRGGQFFAGNALTWADVMAFNFVNNLPDQSCMAKFPKMKNLVDRVAYPQHQDLGREETRHKAVDIEQSPQYAQYSQHIDIDFIFIYRSSIFSSE